MLNILIRFILFCIVTSSQHFKQRVSNEITLLLLSCLTTDTFITNSNRTFSLFPVSIQTNERAEHRRQFHCEQKVPKIGPGDLELDIVRNEKNIVKYF